MLDNCQKIFKIQLQSKSESGGETPPEERIRREINYQSTLQTCIRVRSTCIRDC